MGVGRIIIIQHLLDDHLALCVGERLPRQVPPPPLPSVLRMVYFLFITRPGWIEPVTSWLADVTPVTAAPHWVQNLAFGR